MDWRLLPVLLLALRVPATSAYRQSVFPTHASLQALLAANHGRQTRDSLLDGVVLDSTTGLPQLSSLPASQLRPRRPRPAGQPDCCAGRQPAARRAEPSVGGAKPRGPGRAARLLAAHRLAFSVQSRRQRPCCAIATTQERRSRRHGQPGRDRVAVGSGSGNGVAQTKKCASLGHDGCRTSKAKKKIHRVLRVPN